MLRGYQWMNEADKFKSAESNDSVDDDNDFGSDTVMDHLFWSEVATIFVFRKGGVNVVLYIQLSLCTLRYFTVVLAFTIW
jgi:hypothetical protein